MNNQERLLQLQERLAHLKAERERRLQNVTTPEIPATESTNEPNERLRFLQQKLAELKTEKARRMEGQEAIPAETPENGEFNWSRYIGEQMARGALSLADVLQKIVPNIPMMTAKQMGLGNHVMVENPVELVPETVHAETPLQRIAGRAAQAAPAGLIGGPAAIARNIGTAAGTGAASGALEEAGVPSLWADIASVIGVPAAGAVGRKLIPSGISGKEQKIAQYLQQNIGEKNIPEVSKRLKNIPKHEISGYQPLTAEVAESPTFSQLHRLQYEIPGSGLPQHAGSQNDALMAAIDEATSNASLGRNLREPIQKKIEKLENIRHEATSAPYKEIELMEEPLNPKHTRNLLREKMKTAVGSSKKDYRYVRDLIKPTERITPADKEYYKFYESIPKDKTEYLSKLEKPKNIYPTVSQLKSAGEDLNDVISTAFRSGKKNKVRRLTEAKNAIYQDLEKVPLHRETTAKYHELSKPISEIKEHPSLKSILDEKKLKRRLTNHMGKLFDTASKDNVGALKKAIGEDTKTWEHIREASVEHFVKSVSNAGAEGKGHVLSYPKMRRFLEHHHDALDELLDKDQMKLVYEIERIVKGQNRAKTLGRGEGSPTHARLRSDLGLKETTGMKAAELAASTQPGLVKKGIGVFLNNWGKNHHEQMMNVLNRALLEPEYAHKLINLKPKTQLEFNKFINSSLRRAPVIATHQEEEKE